MFYAAEAIARYGSLRFGQAAATWRIVVVMSGAWLTLNGTVGALPGVINTVLGVTTDVNTGILIGAAIAAALYPLIGIANQKIGRRRAIIVIGLLSLLPASALYYVLVTGAYRRSASLIALVAVIVVLSIPVWAVHTPYLAESFRTAIRSSGDGISYSLATILPGFYSFYMLGLAKLMPYEMSPIILLALGGLLLSVGALAGPETKHVDLHEEARVQGRRRDRAASVPGPLLAQALLGSDFRVTRQRDPFQQSPLAP